MPVDKPHWVAAIIKSKQWAKKRILMNTAMQLEGLRTRTEDRRLVLRLRTLTPLYTGGIGQMGDQVHPSNLLGGTRHMACTLARTLGDGDFERSVWGHAGGGEIAAQAKQIALRWDTSNLQRINLPSPVAIPREGSKDSRWWFNTAFKGDLTLHLTRMGISDRHWLILQLAIAIQLRHSAFGAKDQFGFGVLSPLDSTPWCRGIRTDFRLELAITQEPHRLNLLRYAFAKVQFRPTIGHQKPTLNYTTALKLGLAVRAALRNALRAKDDAPENERDRLSDLRHRMLGQLNHYGSAVNVSAAYGTDHNPELRIVVALKPCSKEERQEVMKAFNQALQHTLDGFIRETTRYQLDGKPVWEFGGKFTKKRIEWINQLAGV